MRGFQTVPPPSGDVLGVCWIGTELPGARVVVPSRSQYQRVDPAPRKRKANRRGGKML